MISMARNQPTRCNPLGWIFWSGPRRMVRVLREQGWRDAPGRASPASGSDAGNEMLASDPRDEWAPLARIIRRDRAAKKKSGEDVWQRLDDHALQDIGLTRTDVRAAANGLLTDLAKSHGPRRRRTR